MAGELAQQGMLSPRMLVAALVLFAGFRGNADAVKDREGAVREDKAALEKDARWIYNDWEKGFAEGRRTGKPVLVVMRCVPCLACSGIDAQVLLQETDLAPLLDQFVCVRVINANAIDLTRFQFDYDLSFSTLFFNADGTVYGRYGSWSHQKDAQDKTTASFRAALLAALDLHRAYPANRPSLSGKQGAPTPFLTPLEIPGLAGKYGRSLDWGGKVVPSCVHCHQIGDAIRTSLREKGKPIPEEWIFPQPGPESVGLRLAADQVATVTEVVADSAAARAGMQVGDELTTVAGQPVISIADVSWALHRAPLSGSLPISFRRAGVAQRRQLPLVIGWRQHTDISRRVGTWELRAMVTGGMLLEDLTDTERQGRHLDHTSMALRAKYVGLYGQHAAAHKAGFKTDDILVSVDGLQARVSESELMGRLMSGHAVGERITAEVVRGGERLKLEWPVQ